MLGTAGNPQRAVRGPSSSRVINTGRRQTFIRAFLIEGRLAHVLNYGANMMVQGEFCPEELVRLSGISGGYQDLSLGEFPGRPAVKTRAFTAVDPGSIPGQGTKIPQAMWCSQKQTNKNDLSLGNQNSKG